MAELVIDALEVIQVDHDDRQRMAGAPRSSQLAVECLKRVPAVEAAGQAVAQAELPRFEKQLHVPDADCDDGCRLTEAPAVLAIKWRTSANAENADHGVGCDQRKTHV